MTLTVSPTPLLVLPLSTATLTIRNPTTTGYCYEATVKYKGELDYSPRRGFIAPQSAQLVIVSALKKLTPDLKIQVVAVAVEQSLGVPDSSTIKAIMHGTKQLKTRCVSIKVPVVTRDSRVEIDRSPLLSQPQDGTLPTHVRRGKVDSVNGITDSEISIFEGMDTNAQKISSLTHTEQTETFYKNDSTYASMNASQFDDSSFKKKWVAAPSYVVDSLSNDVSQLRLEFHALEGKINTALESILSATDQKRLDANAKLSEDELNTLITAVVNRLATTLKKDDEGNSVTGKQAVDGTGASGSTVNGAGDAMPNPNSDPKLKSDLTKTSSQDSALATEEGRRSCHQPVNDVDQMPTAPANASSKEDAPRSKSNTTSTASIAEPNSANMTCNPNSTCSAIQTTKSERTDSEASSSAAGRTAPARRSQYHGVISQILALLVIFGAAIIGKLIKKSIQSRKSA